MNVIWHNWRELKSIIFRLLITVKFKNLIDQICLVYLNIAPEKKDETFNTLKMTFLMYKDKKFDSVNSRVKH